MADFTWTPDYGARKQSKPSVTRVQFGDGYESRIAVGINTDLKRWEVKFSMRDDTEAGEIDTFLAARGGSEAFTWQAPGDSEEKSYVCREWSYETVRYNLNTITAVFEEVAEP